MLCGVGGKTVAEAKDAITYVEFVQWCKFRARYGSFHIGMRIDRAAARLGSLFANIQAGKSIWLETDLSPFDHAILKQQEEERELDIDSVFATLTKIAQQPRAE